MGSGERIGTRPTPRPPRAKNGAGPPATGGAVRAPGVTLRGLALALAVRGWLPLGVRGVVLVGTVAVGAALAVATVGALRLGGRGQAGAWLAAGLVIGGLWVLLR